jgi:hypothetical protein|nr:hypothetical protein [Paraburkholderia sp. BL8N3]
MAASLKKVRIAGTRSPSGRAFRARPVEPIQRHGFLNRGPRRGGDGGFTPDCVANFAVDRRPQSPWRREIASKGRPEPARARICVHVGVYVGVYVEWPGAQVATNTKTHAARDARSTTGVTARRKIEER